MRYIEEKVILVDENDNQIGTEEKIKAHQEGKLHRCFSIVVFNSKKELLIQKRTEDKYHSSGLWTNTCCSHPIPGEDTKEAAHRRLKQEMGFDCDLKESFTFIYKRKFNNGLTEHEYDHVFIGEFEGSPNPNPEEVSDWKWITRKELENDIQKNPNNYTYWFKILIDKIG
jgi:isopentenyl-diphosphate delta-isomerase